MKIGTFHDNDIEQFLAHRNPIAITDTVYRQSDYKIVKFSVKFDDGITLNVKSPFEDGDVQLQYESFIELIRLSKLGGKQVIEN